jgi:sulfide:quinone oxidoreductase
MPKNVIVIGAGFGGLGCAKTFADAKDSSGVAVTVIDAKSWFTIGGTWQYAWAGRVDTSSTTWDLSKCGAQFPGVSMLLDTDVASLDLEGKKVVLGDGSALEYDHLVLSPGVVGDPSSVPGMDATLDMYSHDSIERQRADVQDIIANARAGETQTLLVAIGAVPYKCPVAPFEAAFIADDVIRRHGVRDKVDIVVTAPVAWPLPDPAKEVFTRLFEEKNVRFLPEKTVVSIEGGVKAEFARGDAIAASKIWSVYPQRAPDFVKATGVCNLRGFVPVNIATNGVEGSDGVYCIGDCCGIAVGGKPHPKAGEFAWQMGEMVAHEIMRTESYEHSRLGACIAECGAGAGVLVAPDYTQCVKDPEGGKPSCAIQDRKTDGEAAKLDWVNKYIRNIFGEGGRRFEPAAAA